MPREARRKTNESIFHVMVRSIKEINLFNDNEDKIKYLKLIRENQVKLNFKVYAYCLMDNHGHFMVDANGADISTIMHSINGSFARYYNRKYDRYGHVFQDRFKSKTVDDNKYAVALSAYIHNNAKNLPKYKDNIEEYEYSSLKYYMNNKADQYNILDKTFLTEVINLNYVKIKEQYVKLVKNADNIDQIKEDIDGEFNISHCEYRSERKILPRKYSANDIINFVTKYTKVDNRLIHIKYDKKAKETRALCIFLMRCFCNYSQRQICEIIGNLTASRVSVLGTFGFKLVMNDAKYGGIIDNFIQTE